MWLSLGRNFLLLPSLSKSCVPLLIGVCPNGSYAGNWRSVQFGGNSPVHGTKGIPGWVHQGHCPMPAVKKIYLPKNILNQYRNYVIKYFYPKLSHSLICIKIPYSKIPNNAPSLPAKILTLLCFEVEQIWDQFCTTGGTCIVKMVSDLLYLKA